MTFSNEYWRQKLRAGVKPTLLASYTYIMEKSLSRAGKRQGLTLLKERLVELVPDLSEQYSNFAIDTSYLETKVRYQHAFQVSLINRAIEYLNLKDSSEITVVDIGDSAGSHIMYIKGLYPRVRALSINLDIEAVKRIQGKGLEAIHARAEDIADYDIKTDIFLSFEMLEHLSDPIQFLKSLADHSQCQALVLTVPYVRQSRVGLHHIRNNDNSPKNAEGTHILELSPEDWMLLIKHSGWKIIDENTYCQYPKWSIFHLTKWLWKRFDFEGFWGAVLVPDTTWSSVYLDW